MEHPLITAVLLVMGFNLGWLLIRLFGPPETAVLPEGAYVHDPVTRLLSIPASHVGPPLAKGTPRASRRAGAGDDLPAASRAWRC